MIVAWVEHRYPIDSADPHDQYVGPVPELVHFNPERTQAFEFLKTLGPRSAKVRPEIRPLLAAVVGDALSCAIRLAAYADELATAPQQLALTGVLGATENAADSLNKALNAIALHQHPRGRYVAATIRQTRMTAVKQPRSRKEFAALVAKTRREAATLLVAQRILKRLAKDIRVTKDEALPPIKNREPDKTTHAFIGQLAEAWVYITGEKPSKNSSSNAFLEFARAAWWDWQCQDWKNNIGLPKFITPLRAWLAVTDEARLAALVVAPPWLIEGLHGRDVTE